MLKKQNCEVYVLVRWMHVIYVRSLNVDMRERMNARCLLMCITQPSYLIIRCCLRWLKLLPMLCSKTASRSPHLKCVTMPEAVPLRTCPGPPSVAWNILRQLESMKTFARVGQHAESNLKPQNQKCGWFSSIGQVVACWSRKKMAQARISGYGVFCGVPSSGTDLYRDKQTNRESVHYST